MRAWVVTSFVRVVALLLVVAGCSSPQQDAFEGVLPDGTVFAFTYADASPLDAMPDSIVMIDVPGEQAQAIGIHRYERVGDNNVPPRESAVVLRTESWLLVIDLYPEVQGVLVRNETKIEDLLAMREVRGLPVLTLKPPLRFAVADETPRQTEVAYGNLAVRHGCDDSRALVCSDDRQLQVVPTEPADSKTDEIRIENR